MIDRLSLNAWRSFVTSIRSNGRYDLFEQRFHRRLGLQTRTVT